MPTMLQHALDKFHHGRRDIVASLAFLTLRLYGKEVAYKDVKDGKYTPQKSEILCLDAAKNIDLILETAKSTFLDAEKRFGSITDKCQTLITLGSLLLGLAGLLLPKYLAFDSVWMRWLSVVTVAILFDAIIVLSLFFDVGTSMGISLEQKDVPLDSSAYKKNLALSYLQCAATSENRTNYLVDLYLAARFCFLSALTGIAILVFVSLLMNNQSGQIVRIAQEMRSDPALINLLRGPKGDPGVQGLVGPKGEKGLSVDADDILNRLLTDVRFRKEIERIKCGGIKKTP